MQRERADVYLIEILNFIATACNSLHKDSKPKSKSIATTLTGISDQSKDVTLFQQEITSLARQVSYLTSERDKLNTTVQNSQTSHTKETQLLRQHLQHWKEEFNKERLQVQEKDRALQSALTEAFILKEHVKKLDHQMQMHPLPLYSMSQALVDNGSSPNNLSAVFSLNATMHSHTSNDNGGKLVQFKTRKEQQRLIQESNCMRNQVDALRHELYKEKMNR